MRVWGVLFCAPKSSAKRPVRSCYPDGTAEPFTTFKNNDRVVFEQHLGEG